MCRMAEALPEVARGMLRRVRQNRRTVVASVAALVFLALLEDVNEGSIMKLDTLAYTFFVVDLRTPWLTPVMEDFSALAAPVVICAMLLVVAAFAPGKRPGWCALANLVLVVLLNQLLKGIVQRPRPDGFRLISEAGYSFPSGHSMISMAFYGLLAWLVWHYERDRVLRWVFCLAFALVIVMVGVSRIYLGVHYASDVIAGFCVSLVWLAFYTKVIAPLFLPGVGSRRDLREPSEEGARRAL